MPVMTPQKLQPQLTKAKLKPYDGGVSEIDLMFNPSQIKFSRSVTWAEHKGNRGKTLLPKINFSGVEPYKFTLTQLIFDTYETKESVMTKYINKIKEGVEAIQRRDKRAPVYTFIWKDEYFYCVMTNLSYTLNMFLSDGTPVRAMVDISLQEVDKNNIPGGTKSAAKAERQNNPQSAAVFQDGGGQPNQGGQGGQPNQGGQGGQPNQGGQGGQKAQGGQGGQGGQKAQGGQGGQKAQGGAGAKKRRGG
jgi:Contractile injection system tube protein